jgi:hypothetical protein
VVFRSSLQTITKNFEYCCSVCNSFVGCVNFDEGNFVETSVKSENLTQLHFTITYGISVKTHKIMGVVLFCFELVK